MLGVGGNYRSYYAPYGRIEELEPVQFPVLDRAGPRLDQTGLDLLDQRRPMRGVFDILCTRRRPCGCLADRKTPRTGCYCQSD